MRTPALLLACALLGGCPSPALLPPPSTLANRTTLDERGAIRVEQLYQAAALVAVEADRLGLVPAAARARIAAADARAYAAVQAVRAAYDVGNAPGYAAALARAEAAKTALVAAIRG